MKFFRREVIDRISECPQDFDIADEAYAGYLARIESRIPRSFLKLHKEYSLHDSLIQQVLQDGRALKVFLDAT